MQHLGLNLLLAKFLMDFRLFITLIAVCLSTLVSGGRLLIQDGPVLENNFNYCSPTGSAVVVCEPTDPADVNGVSFWINDVNKGWDGNAPYQYYIPNGLSSAKVSCVVTGSNGGWKETIEVSGVFGCNDVPPVLKKAYPSPIPVAANRAYCVTMPALSFTNSINTNHWTEDGKALVYRPEITNPHRVFPAGSDPLVYKFRVPIRSHYALTMDSETTQKTDFNDCWLKFNGLTLRKVENGRQWPLRVGLTGSLKAYQNSARRLKAAYSVDGRYHSFETTNVLEPGREYTIRVEGRSPQFKFFGLIMFPCKDATCWHETPHHEAYRWTCNV